jgi:hypothetical protein
MSNGRNVSDSDAMACLFSQSKESSSEGEDISCAQRQVPRNAPKKHSKVGDDNGGKGKEKRNRASNVFALTFSEPVKYKILKKMRVCQEMAEENMFGQYVVANEWGLTEKFGHTHMYGRTMRKWKLADLREWIIANMSNKLSDLQTCKRPKDWLRYITKDDGRAVVEGVDAELLHINWKMYN